MWKVFLILTALDLHLAHFDEAAGNLAEVAGSDSRNHYQHNFLFLMTCNPFPSFTPQSSDYSWYWEPAALSHTSNPWAQDFSGMYSVFTALFISFIATELSASLVSFFGWDTSFSPVQRLVWFLVSTWADLKDNLEVKHGCLWEALFYECLWKEKMISHDGAWRYWEEKGLSSTVKAHSWKR